VKTVKCLAFLIFTLFCFFAIGNAYAEMTSSKENKHVQIEERDTLSASTLKLKKRDPALFISVEAVLQKLKEKQGIILIDVRSNKDFEQFRIAGSINIPLFAIKTKVFLKSKPIVLINEGYNFGQLEVECKRLRESGFSVSILDGGLSQWKQKGMPIEGDLLAQKELNKISPQQYFPEKDYLNWIAIDVSLKEESETKDIMPRVIHIPYSNKTEFISKLRAIINEHKEPMPISILICDDKGENYEAIEKLIQQHGILPVFYLRGGLVGYKAFEQLQVKIQQDNDEIKKIKSTRTIKKCTTCP
jgi:rhodanese-related sulfurtransferase